MLPVNIDVKSSSLVTGLREGCSWWAEVKESLKQPTTYRIATTAKNSVALKV